MRTSRLLLVALVCALVAWLALRSSSPGDVVTLAPPDAVEDARKHSSAALVAPALDTAPAATDAPREEEIAEAPKEASEQAPQRSTGDEPTPKPAPDEPVLAAHGEARATLVVHAVVARTYEPVASYPVLPAWQDLKRRQDDLAEAITEERVAALFSSPWKCTSSDGTVVMSVPAGEKIRISSGGSTSSNACGEAVFASRVSQVRALEPGETFHLTVEAERLQPYRFLARIVSGADGLPVAGARILLERGLTAMLLPPSQEGGIRFGSWWRSSTSYVNEDTAESDSQGLFALDLPADKFAAYRVEATGFGPRLFVVRALASPEIVHEIEVLPCAALELTGLDPSTLAYARVSVSPAALCVDDPASAVVAGKDLKWTLWRDELQALTFDCLPAGVRLQVEVNPRGWRRKPEKRSVVLDPGVRTLLDWTERER